MGAIVNIEFGQARGQKGLFGQCGIGVFRCDPRHGDNTFDQWCERALRQIGGGDSARTLADENPQAHIAAFRAFHIFQFAKPPAHAQRLPLQHHGFC